MASEDVGRLAQDCWLEQSRAAVRRAGADLTGYDPAAGDACCWATTKQKGYGRPYYTEPCGDSATVVLRLRSPSEPDGCKLALCRKHLAALTKDLIDHLAQ